MLIDCIIESNNIKPIVELSELSKPKKVKSIGSDTKTKTFTYLQYINCIFLLLQNIIKSLDILPEIVNTIINLFK